MLPVVPLAAVPVGLSATGSPYLVTLTWTASSGATSYNVLRSMQHGGPYTQFATATSPAYFDGAVLNGTAVLSVVVSAVNLPAELAANSAEVSATPTAPAAPPAAPLAAVPAGLAANRQHFRGHCHLDRQQ